ncbi:MAG TPA: IPT/TIG domain-containing protein, partial [Candidatus Paceibacterota bacterium]|nr:IPT/TIG domain-containing protein [Candidatus Paceibacterota bacterium]
ATNYIASTNRFVVLPTITSFTPNFGKAGTSVTIYGENLLGATNVWFAGVKNTAALTGISYGQLTVTVPAGATNGYIKVGTTNGTYTSSQLFHLPPVIGSFLPTNGPEDTLVTIRGTNFLADSVAVTFNGTPAKAFYVTNNNLMAAVVPAGVISGPIYLTTTGGTTNTVAKWFHGVPIIYSFSPTHGLPGTNITIYGTNFIQVTNVSFNGTNAAFTANTNGTITAIVPTNAYTGPISVTAVGGVGTSVDPFTVDYSSDLAVLISAPGSILLGTDYNYVITITNRGPNTAPAVTLTNLLPGEVTLKSASKSQGSLVTSGNPVTGALGDIPAFSKATVTLKVTPQVTGIAANTASVASGFPDPNPADNVSTVNVTIYVVPLLSIQTSSNQVQLSWSVNLSDYVLQSTSDLTSSNSWINVGTTPEYVGDQIVVTETIGSGPKFYRLKR